MTATDITLEQLRACIGREVTFEGVRYRITEILSDADPVLVLSNDNTDTVIQANQHGEATRRVPPIRTVPVFSAEDGQVHPALLKLILS
jgi:hypothetical protein